MKIKPSTRELCPTLKDGLLYDSFDVIEYCCDRMKEELGMDDDIEFYHTIDDEKEQTISFGEQFEYTVDDVKFCPFCGERIKILWMK